MSEPEQPAEFGQATTTDASPGDSAQKLLNMLQRERADFLNYKRRVEREREQDREAGQLDVIRALLPLLDELDRALAQVPADLAPHAWVRGISLSRHRLARALTDLGVERIGAAGEPFDPARHEALFFDTQPESTDQRVSTVINPGFRLGDRLLRPAQVGVVGPAEQAAVASQPGPHAPDGGGRHQSEGDERPSRSS
jgi:molecular chaperone GrpE